jgi:Prokaryotic lipoprotein-attachment site
VTTPVGPCHENGLRNPLTRLPSPTQPCGLGPPSPAVRERGFARLAFEPLSRTAGEGAERSEAGEGKTRFSGRVRGQCTQDRRTLIASFLMLTLALAGCGKRGPPEPPPDEPVTYPRPYPSE